MATNAPAQPITGTPAISGYRLDLGFPAVGDKPDESQAFTCPRCGCRGFHRHQRTVKHVKDQRQATVSSIRYLCKQCRRSVRRYPDGVSARRQSDAVRALSVVLYRLGLSYRNIQHVLTGWGCGLGAATIWQNVQSLGAAERTGGRRGRLTVMGGELADRAVYPTQGSAVHIRLVTDPDGSLRLEVRTRDDWRGLWRRIETPGLRSIGVRLLGVKALLARPDKATARAVR